jgi:hypothetical protein
LDQHFDHAVETTAHRLSQRARTLVTSVGVIALQSQWTPFLNPSLNCEQLASLDQGQEILNLSNRSIIGNWIHTARFKAKITGMKTAKAFPRQQMLNSRQS